MSRFKSFVLNLIATDNVDKWFNVTHATYITRIKLEFSYIVCRFQEVHANRTRKLQ